MPFLPKMDQINFVLRIDLEENVAMRTEAGDCTIVVCMKRAFK